MIKNACVREENAFKAKVNFLFKNDAGQPDDKNKKIKKLK